MALTTYTFSVTGHASANTKGSYTEIVSATPYASGRLVLVPIFATTSPRWIMVDLATGGAGAETVIVQNIPLSAAAGGHVGWYLPIDVDIPAGTRLAARCQTATGGVVMYLQVFLEDRALGSVANPVTYGAVTASTRGTQIDPGGTINTKGSYVQLTASTTADIDALAVLIGEGNAESQTYSAYTDWKIDVATGAAGAETVVIADLWSVAQPTVNQPLPGAIRVPVTIAAGTRLAVRCQSSINTAGTRLLNVALIGIQEPAAAGGGSGNYAVGFVG